MCMRSRAEGCELAAQQEALKKDVAALDRRMTTLENSFDTMRSETQSGFRQGAESMREINKSVSNLAHDFGERMNNLDKRIVAEKEKWGETLRWVVKLTVRVVLAGAAVAMGITAIESFLK